MKDMLSIKPEDFQRLFRLKGGILYLTSDIFGGYYRNLDCLLVSDNGAWTSYLPKTVVAKTLEAGLKILGSGDDFKEYVTGFEDYKKRSTDFFEALFQKTVITREETVKAFDLLSELFSFYSKTEFFYTDLAYAKLKDSPTEELKRNIESFEKVKNSGREYLNKLIFDGGYSDRLIDLLSKQFNVPVDDIRMYQVVETIGLFDGKKVSDDKLKSRRGVFVMWSRGSMMSYLEGAEAKQVSESFSIQESENEIKGTIANKGKLKGRIKVIPTDYYSDFSILKKLFEEMKQGDILVAETTSPELMPACKKAGAIVTDQGGMLSHAAIVSRELGIPCVVGTGNATEVFRDGDMVEVDADKGIVRKI